MSLLTLSEVRVELPIGGVMRPVVENVSLDVQAGEAVGFAGESGSGKSMTARSIVRLLPPGAAISGSIIFDGANVAEMDTQQLYRFRGSDVSMVFQDPRAHINPLRTIGDFLTEALVRVRRVPLREARAKVIGLLSETGIPRPARRLDQLPHELSGGLLQRVMIAAALAVDPRLLIADEPTTSLDVINQAEVIALLDHLRQDRGLALLLITHDLDLAAAVCDRTAVMYAGSIAEVQESASLHEAPLHPYTAALGRSRATVDRTAERLTPIPGRPIAAFERPPGCPFAPRCAYAQDHCRQAVPVLRSVAHGLAACHRTEEVLLGPANAQENARV